MSKEVIKTETGLVIFKDDTVKTTSHLVAEKFGKMHKNVLQTIDALHKVQPEFAQLNFQLMQLFNDLPNGGHQPVKYYEMTQAGFTILAMGFTGEKALQFKVDYITAFETMRKMLFNKKPESIPLLSDEVRQAISTNTTERNTVVRHQELSKLVDQSIVVRVKRTRTYYEYHLTEKGKSLGFRTNKNGTILNPIGEKNE